MSDTDGNGFFDRWEVYDADDPVPVRVSTGLDERATRIPFDDDRLVALYTQQVLPEAIAANRRIMNAMSDVRPFPIAPGLERAARCGTGILPVNHGLEGHATCGSLNVQRFAQDVIREMQYQDLRRHYTARANEILRSRPQDDLRKLKPGELETTENSHYAWRLVRVLADLDVAYGQGDFDRACALLADLRELESTVTR
jgi:hypothetical protein